MEQEETNTCLNQFSEKTKRRPIFFGTLKFNPRFLITYTYDGQKRRFEAFEVREIHPFWKRSKDLFGIILITARHIYCLYYCQCMFLNKLSTCTIAHLRETVACRLYNKTYFGGRTQNFKAKGKDTVLCQMVHSWGKFPSSFGFYVIVS